MIDVPLVLIYIVVSAVIFIGGGTLGWMLASSNRKVTKKRLRVVIAVAVTVVWGVTIVAEIIIPAYTVSMLIHGIMGAVVGYLFSEEGITINLGQKK